MNEFFLEFSPWKVVVSHILIVVAIISLCWRGINYNNEDKRFVIIIISVIAGFFSACFFGVKHEEAHKRYNDENSYRKESEFGDIVSLQNGNKNELRGQIGGSFLGFSGSVGSNQIREFITFLEKDGLVSFYEFPASSVRLRFVENKPYKVFLSKVYYTDYYGMGWVRNDSDLYIIEIDKKDLERYVSIRLQNFQ